MQDGLPTILSIAMTPPTADIRVAVALMIDRHGSLLLGRRGADKPYPLLWEFPGGKIETGEEAAAALRRELQEELAIDAEIGPRLSAERNQYDDGRTFLVEYFLVTRWNGELVNIEFEALAWVRPEELLRYEILPGNVDLARRIVSGEFPPLRVPPLRVPPSSTLPPPTP